MFALGVVDGQLNHLLKQKDLIFRFNSLLSLTHLRIPRDLGGVLGGEPGDQLGVELAGELVGEERRACW